MEGRLERQNLGVNKRASEEGLFSPSFHSITYLERHPAAGKEGIAFAEEGAPGGVVLQPVPPVVVHVAQLARRGLAHRNVHHHRLVGSNEGRREMKEGRKEGRKERRKEGRREGGEEGRM